LRCYDEEINGYDMKYLQVEMVMIFLYRLDEEGGGAFQLKKE